MFKYAQGLSPTQMGAWRYVLSEHPVQSICYIHKLYVLQQLIVTQSADVERGFSMVVQTLGLGRLSTSTATLDARLRIKENMPNTPSCKYLEMLGTPKDPDSAEPSTHEIYSNILKQGGCPVKIMSKELHAAAGIEKDIFWTEVLAKEFDAADENVCSNEEVVAGGTRQQGDLQEMIRLLQHGLPSTDDQVQVVE